jgi:chorismate synthase
MRGNQFGKMISMSTFGESHGEAYGVIIDGVPSGLDFSLDDLQSQLDLRAPGKLAGTTTRKEEDKAEVLSGIFEGKTSGTPIAVLVRNTNQRSADYDKLKNQYRPGHADKTYIQKYGVRDHRGGGRSSGRETLCRVIGGYFAGLVIPQIKVKAYISKLAHFECHEIPKNPHQNFGPYHVPNIDPEEVKKYLLDLQKSHDSIGGQIVVVIDDCPSGLGEPCFDKLKADLAKALLSIGACFSFSFGLGEKMSELKGSEVSKNRENFGGMEGGISNGERITLLTTFKPTSTIGGNAKEGRHDPCILPRAVPVVEAMVRFVLADHYLRQCAYPKLEE